MTLRLGITIFALLLALPGAVLAGVLPDDRGDALYHHYTGGGVDITGPSVLIRKKAGKSLSFVGNWYVDHVSSASIDVITTASPYTEERTQWSLGMDYLRGNTTMRFNYVSSEESDFDATTYAFSVSEDMFGDLTTLTLSYAFGEDVVGRSDDPTFERDNTRQHYGISLTQILTRNMIATFNFETITDEGFLNNPYRSVRYAGPGQRSRLQLRAGGVPGNTHVECGRFADALFPALPGSGRRRISVLYRYLGHRRGIRYP